METSRREFLASAAAAGTLAVAGTASAVNDQPVLKMGVIGVGWYGMVDAKAALKVGGVKIAAVCDVDSEHLKTSADELEKLQGERPAEFKLYEEMLDKVDLDVVVIASPPHWHALHLIAALGPWSGRLLREAFGLRHPRGPCVGRRCQTVRTRRADRFPASPR